MAAKLRREHTSTCRAYYATGGAAKLRKLPEGCSCGADAHNAQVDALLAAIDEEQRHADRLAARLIAVREPLAELAAPQEGYGSGGGDPRDFTPDPECSTEEERARHRADCEKAERGEPIDTPTGCHFEGDALVNYQGWGLGTYTYRDEESVTRLAAVDADIAAHRARRGGQ
jgi:hypothetical protein